jgi:hypothetical protein
VGAHNGKEKGRAASLLVVMAGTKGCEEYDLGVKE